MRKEPKQENEDTTKTFRILRKKNYLTVGSVRQLTEADGHYLSSAGIISTHNCSSSIRCWGWNAGSHACYTNILLTELCPSPILGLI